MLIATQFPVNGMSVAFAQEESSTATDVSHPFAIIVALYKSNEILLAELRSVNAKSAGAEAYLAQVGSNPHLGRAQILRLRIRRSAVLTLLRANRVQARAILASKTATALSA